METVTVKSMLVDGDPDSEEAVWLPIPSDICSQVESEANPLGLSPEELERWKSPAQSAINARQASILKAMLRSRWGCSDEED